MSEFFETVMDGMVAKTGADSAPLLLAKEERDALRALLNEAIADTGSNRKAELFASVRCKLDAGDGS